MMIASIASGFLVIGLGVAFYTGTYFFLTKGHSSWMALLFWALFLWWQVFPVFVAGFGANFEFRNLLRFPMSLEAFYLLGLGYGFSDFAAVSSICWIGSMIVAATSCPHRRGSGAFTDLPSIRFVKCHVGTSDRLLAGKNAVETACT